LYVPYSSFALERRLAHSVHVYNTSCLAQNRHHGQPLNHSAPSSFPLFPLAFASNLSLRLLRISQPFKWLARSPSYHTHTHALPLPLPFSPVGGRTINNRLSASPSIQSYLIPSFRTHAWAIGLRYGQMREPRELDYGRTQRRGTSPGGKSRRLVDVLRR